MARKTRLDAIVKLREAQETEAKLAVAKAAARTARARDELESARRAASRSRLEAGTAADWVMRQLEHERAVARVRACEAAVEERTAAEQEARAALEAAYRTAEAMRRAQASRRDVLAKDDAERDRKSSDEIGVMRYRRPGSGS
ncbi:MAG TPA: hypothetical protein VN033_02480 [Vulgatibacter sp.]|nr:hypothetical protein [Vulgatibacter sp.]